MRITRFLIVPLIFPAMVAAQSANKFQVDGAILTYDTENVSDADAREIESDDVDVLLDVLRKETDVAILRLNSTGGSVWAGNEMARIVQDFELDTLVDGECSSSCVTVFLAGHSRSMTRGSKVGFHQRSWSSDGTQSYFDRWRDEEGWETPFDFASWIYKDTQSEIWKELTYMVSRGVDASFAIETKRSRSGIWFPTRNELKDAGVLRDSDTADSWLP